MTRFFDWFNLAALICLVCLGMARAVGLHVRGVRVVVIDRGRSLAQALRDLLLVILLFVWAYEIVARALSFEIHLGAALPGIALIESTAVKWVGSGVAAAGLAIYWSALRALGDSWRLGIDRNTPGALVDQGVFAWTRNPIYIALDLLVLGTFLIQGRLLFLALALLIMIMLHDQILREERFLLSAHGTFYRDYAARVGRYLSLRRLRS